MNSDNPLHTNRLIDEKSPYLLQHAHNPVDWHPWGNEAFQLAKSQNKPIFLSIGYATCHWCHVMERESFASEDLALMMNETFVNIKVDREELPEIDHLYMEFAQTMLSGAAGWPLNVVLTPELKPFFATTYLPTQSREGMMGMKELVQRIEQIWNSEERDKVSEQAEKIVEIYEENQPFEGFALPSRETMEDTMEILFKLADPTYGGLKGVPKFPIGYHINFFLAYAAKSKDSRASFLAERTLDMMHRGGIYDHLAGGFSRYSIDEQWLVPHFEKMVYDNAILALSYCRAWQSSHKLFYKQTAQEILDYVLSDMTHPEGGFYSAEDSETEGQEGLYYTWTYDEIQSTLPETEAELFCEFYGVTDEGNFAGRNILNTPLSLSEFAGKYQLDETDFEQRLKKCRSTLLKKREKRTRPFKDDKILASWNGLMIHAMAVTGCALQEKRYVESALNAAQFINNHLWTDGYLLRRWRDGEAQFDGSLDEYALMIRGELSLFESGCGSEWLETSIKKAEILRQRFKAKGGAFYQTDSDGPGLIVRKCQFTDGSEPSGNAIHCENLLRLYQITGEADYLSQAEDILRTAKHYIDTYPPGYIYSVLNLQRFYDVNSPTFIIALNLQGEHREKISNMIYSRFIPYRAVIWRSENDEKLFNLIPSLLPQGCVEGKTTLYLCRQGACMEPMFDLDKMQEAIDSI